MCHAVDEKMMLGWSSQKSLCNEHKNVKLVTNTLKQVHFIVFMKLKSSTSEQTTLNLCICLTGLLPWQCFTPGEASDASKLYKSQHEN